MARDASRRRMHRSHWAMRPVHRHLLRVPACTTLAAALAIAAAQPQFAADAAPICATAP